MCSEVAWRVWSRSVMTLPAKNSRTPPRFGGAARKKRQAGDNEKRVDSRDNRTEE